MTWTDQIGSLSTVEGTPNLRRNTLDLLGAQVFRNLGPILLLLLLARFMDQATVGQFSLILAIATPFFVFAQLGLRTVSLTLNPTARFAAFVKTQLVAVCVAILVVLVVGALAVPALLVVVGCVVLLKSADAFADFLAGPIQRRHRTGIVLRASVVTAVGASAAAAVTLLVSQQLAPTVFAVAIASMGATYLTLYLPARHLARNEPDEPAGRAEVTLILRAGVPLGLTTAILALISTFPQYILTASQGPAETARFAVLLYVYALADLVTGAVSQAWIPTAQYQLASGGGKGTVRLALQRAGIWTAIYLPGTTIGLVLVAVLFPLIFGPDYTLSVAEAIPLGLAIVILPAAHFLAVGVAIENYYAHTLIVAALSAAVAVLGCLVLIPSFGVSGAFIALLGSVAVRALVAAGILLWFLRQQGRGESS